MSIASVFRSRKLPRRTGQHEIPAAAAITAAPQPAWSAVPLAQEQARRASGPQPAITPSPASDPFPQVRDWPLAHPPARVPHPYGAAPQGTAGRGSQHTEAYTPEFAQAASRPRPYVPSVPLPPEAPAIGDALTREWWPEQPERQSWKAWQQMYQLAYPRVGAGLSELRAFMKAVDEITGTRGNGRWPLAALPAADERWGAMSDALQDAAEALGDTEKGRAHARLNEVVRAAPDFETAQRLTQNAAEADIIGVVRLAPVTAEQDGAAA